MERSRERWRLTTPELRSRPCITFTAAWETSSVATVEDVSSTSPEDRRSWRSSRSQHNAGSRRASPAGREGRAVSWRRPGNEDITGQTVADTTVSARTNPVRSPRRGSRAASQPTHKGSNTLNESLTMRSASWLATSLSTWLTELLA